MVVQHNLSAMNANRTLGITTGVLNKCTEKLSSGYKINRAADDAAGLSISEKMRKQIRGLSRAALNAEDGISMVQTADGALEEVHGMLQRMNELCVQAANGTNATSDRRYIQDEVNQLITEIDRVSQTTKFNEIYLLNGSIANPASYANTKAAYNKKIGDTKAEMDVSGAAMVTALNGENKGQIFSLDDIKGNKGINIVYQAVTDSAVTTTPDNSLGTYESSVSSPYLENMLKNSIVPQAVQALVNTYGQIFGYLNGSTIEIGLVLEYNASSDALASVTFDPTKLGSFSEPTLGYKLTVNTKFLPSLTVSSLSDADRNSLEVTIVHEMMHAFMDEAFTNGMLGLDPVTHTQNMSANCFPKWFTEGMAQSAAGGCYNGNDWVNGATNISNLGLSGLGITSASTEDDIKNSLAIPQHTLASDTTTARYGTGYLACMYLGWIAAGKPSSLTAGNLANGVDKVLQVIRGTNATDGMSLDEAIRHISSSTYAGLADFESRFGTAGDASVNFVKNLVTAAGATGTGGLIGRGFSSFDNTTGILSNSDLTGISLFQLKPAKGREYNT